LKKAQLVRPVISDGRTGKPARPEVGIASDASVALRLCGIDVAPVRAAPDEVAEQVTQALLGEPLAVEETNGGWARIRTAYDYPGWVRTDALGQVVGTVPRTWLPEPSPNAAPLEEARAYLGAPYDWGGMTERGIDCSGLVHMAHRRLGTLVPRDAHQQEAAGEPVDQDELLPGDLVCFGPAGAAHHIAFWLGDGRILHATDREGTGRVLEEPLENARGAHELRFVRL
jgi:cell wall-associated NlpC family hydrolase